MTRFFNSAIASRSRMLLISTAVAVIYAASAVTPVLAIGTSMLK
jgi:hypothetical protein